MSSLNFRENNASDSQTLDISSDTSSIVDVVELFRSDESNAQNSRDVNVR